MRIFLLGLRRSGTTTLFRTMRQDPRFTCYDEPFNAMFRDFPGGNEWGTHDEYMDLFKRDPMAFWSKFDPIDGIDEIREGFSERQKQFLEYLLASAPNIFMDFTRCNFKVADLHAIAPDAVFVHLYRSAPCIASSHLLPSIWLRRRKLKYWRTQRKFWTLEKKYDFWGFETIIGRHPLSFCGHRFAEIGLDPEEIYKLPAVGRMMAFWRLNAERVEQDGRRYFGDKFVSVHFDRFCREPAAVMEEIYRTLGVSPHAFDFSGIRPPNPPQFPDHPKWRELAQMTGLPDLPL